MNYFFLGTREFAVENSDRKRNIVTRLLADQKMSDIRENVQMELSGNGNAISAKTEFRQCDLMEL